MKLVIDVVDKDNFIHSYSIIEGDALTDKFEKISYETKLVASPDGGSVIKTVISRHHSISDLEIKEDHFKEGKENAVNLFKRVEAYLKDHPDTYN